MKPFTVGVDDFHTVKPGSWTEQHSSAYFSTVGTVWPAAASCSCCCDLPAMMNCALTLRAKLHPSSMGSCFQLFCNSNKKKINKYPKFRQAIIIVFTPRKNTHMHIHKSPFWQKYVHQRRNKQNHILPKFLSLPSTKSLLQSFSRNLKTFSCVLNS